MRGRVYILLIVTACIFYFSIIKLLAQDNKRPTVGVVLSGGGAKGFAHIGVLEVLAEKGIPIDYICGASMGSLVGGLYAAGYSPDSIRIIMETADWKTLMNDNVPRDYITYDGRADYDKYLLGLSFGRKMKPDLPGGLIKGQNLMILLNKYFAPVLNISDFNDLKIPYFCVGSDIIAGKDVILDSGYLPEAIRASIAVPTAFSPVRIDDMLLIDGGFYNNFPTKELKERGVDIIIGVNVGFEAYSTEKIHSVVEVASQLLWINNVKRNIESKEYCNILIEPDLNRFSSSSFSNAEEIINIGKQAAMSSIDQIDSLAKFLAKFNEPARINPNFEASLLSPQKNITSYKIEGIVNTSTNYFMQNMMLETSKPVSMENINNGIMRTIGTLNYESVYYKLLNIDSAYIIDVKVKEKKPISLHLGVGYDSDFKASLRLKVSVRNLFFNSTKFTGSAQISRYPSLILQYVYIPEKNLLNKHFKTYSALGANISLSTFQIFGYNKDRSRISESQMSINNISLFYQQYFKEHFLMEFGILNRFAWYNEIVIGEIPRANEMVVGAYFEVTKDKLNDVSYPTKGDYFKTKIFIDYPYHTSLIPWNLGFFGNYSITVPLSQKVYFYPEVVLGLNLADTICKSRQIFVGGMNSYAFLNNITFAGYGSGELVTNQSLSFNANFRWHIYRNHHMLFKSSVGVFSNSLTDFDKYYIKAGVGLGYSFNSYIGPLEFVVSHSIYDGDSRKFSPKFWVCLGYQF